MELIVMVRFLIIRHGYSKSNKEKKFTGQMDVGLDEAGVIQAECTGKYVAEKFNVDKIYSSDLCRAYDTAEPLSEITGIPASLINAIFSPSSNLFIKYPPFESLLCS